METQMEMDEELARHLQAQEWGQQSQNIRRSRLIIPEGHNILNLVPSAILEQGGGGNNNNCNRDQFVNNGVTNIFAC